jgi:molecular chaperone GrpE
MIQDEGARAAGPVSDTTPPPDGGGPASSPPTAEAEESGAQAVEQDLDALLADARKERDEYLDLARRTKADFENFRKRVAADVQAAQARGKGEVAREVIDAVDNLERALEAAQADDGEGLRAGVEMVLGGLRETLVRHGIEAVDPKGETFDPNQHEALSTMPVEGTESGTVVEVMQKGYRMDEQLLRPARVVVSA